ncbi:hypothetical protein AXK60_23295 [Tsukamurella pseudospumae]|uniref:AbiEi antitoxin C-terminal domain-containing protein n=1 Tax=Tsukamurella pseudospumae TaxID=239498 RepID=A0A138ATJ6_9ACTN|nr:hypothetical protein AXK61_13205 [Tsukamurella pseudospumae]KXP13770.1 hypothetical protein AXK60_23295 [Tsukamurella pseudospumae]
MAAGELEWLASGVYTEPDDSKPWVRYLLRVRAASVNRIHVVSHESAAALHDIPFINPPRTHVHFTTGRDHGGGVRGGKAGKVHLHPRPLLPEEITTVDGILVTSRARTAVDVAMCDDLIRGVGAFDAVRLIRRYPKPDDPSSVPLAELQACVDRLRGRRGAAVAQRALDLSVEHSESPGESWSRIDMLNWKLPRPKLQTEHFIGGRLYVADFDWGTLVGEFDGESKYGETSDERAAALAEEKERAAEFTDSGIEVVRWTWRHLTRTGALHALLLPAMARHGLVVPPLP